MQSPEKSALITVLSSTVHPTPQFERDLFLNLNGTWEFAFDDNNGGLSAAWQDGRKLACKILVPFPYQSELSGINDQAVHEVVWYARDLELPEAWVGQDMLLHFGAVDYKATLWVNGKEVGHNAGGHVPFAFDIGSYVATGVNRITLRVEDTLDPHQPRGKQSKTGAPYTVYYPCTTGIWQTVWLEPAPALRIDSIRTTPDAVIGGFELRVFLHAPYGPYSLDVEVLDGVRPVAKQNVVFSGAAARMFIRIPDAELWSPESPKLYDIKVTLSQGSEKLDEVRSYVGIRSVALSEGKFLLNGAPTYLKMVLDQGYWPESLIATPSDSALKADVEWTKQLGFNGARKHQKIEDPRWLYWCDFLGLMVFEEMPSAKAWSYEAEERLVSEWARAVERDVNNPCIVAWVPFNESWGVPDLTTGHPGQYAFMERVVRMTRRLDPDRPIIGNDGWEHPDLSDICSIHDYSPNGAELKAIYADLFKGNGLPKFAWGTKPIFSHDACHRGQPIMLTEVGGFLFRLPDETLEHLDELFPGYGAVDSWDELPERYTDLMAAIASMPFVCGFCYTQLTDLEQERNGLLTYDRRPKVPVEVIRELHERLFSCKTS